MAVADPDLVLSVDVDRRRRSGAGVERLVVGGALLVTLTALTILGPLLQGYDPADTNLGERLVPPFSDGHLLGTDAVGRDLWSRILEGARWSGGIGAAGTLISAAVGTSVGLLAAMQKGVWRRLLTGLMDAGIAFPYLVLALVIVGVSGRSFASLAVTLGLVTWPVCARVVYTETLRLLSFDYVRAAELMGANPAQVVTRHVLPAIAPTIAVISAYSMGELIIAEGVLSFLGVGAPVGHPSWGNMLAESQPYLVTASWLMIVPAVAIAAWTVSANIFADGLADRTGRSRGRRR